MQVLLLYTLIMCSRVASSRGSSGKDVAEVSRAGLFADYTEVLVAEAHLVEMLLP